MSRKNFSLYYNEDEKGIVRVRFQAVPGNGEVVDNIPFALPNKENILAKRMQPGDLFTDKNGTDFLMTIGGLARTYVQTEHVYEVRGGQKHGQSSTGYYPALTERGVVGMCLSMYPTKRYGALAR